MRSVAVLDRSEEHTSELQSRRHLVCRLLLEKKGSGEAAARTDGRPARHGEGGLGHTSSMCAPAISYSNNAAVRTIRTRSPYSFFLRTRRPPHFPLFPSLTSFPD